ncbi:MAG: glycoside hydrolase family 43 protein [Fibrobacter sp.]|nr:glycoside hydrolase family 43 protein [Fibrobacter sp.]
MNKKSVWFGLTIAALASLSAAAPLNVTLKGNLHNLYSDLTLPATSDDGAKLTWESSDPTFLTHSGEIAARLVNQKKTVTLTAKSGNDSKAFEVTLHEYEPYTNYLFIYFPANNNENIYYAISKDGYNFTAMNGGNRVIAADSVSIKKGLRDPHILRAPDGMFYMVHTDMKSAEGWSSNRGMVLMKSKDLIHWTHSTVHFPDKYKGKNFANVTRVWAPETIWDKDYENTDGTKGRLMIYFSLLTNDGTIPYDKVYYLYANDDFTDVIGEPTYFFDRGSATIDMDIVYNENDSLYHAFFKNEGEGGICKTTAKKLTAPKGQEGSQWSKPSGTLQQTKEAVEGAGVFKLINQDSWILMYDCYNNGHYQFTSSQDLSTFKFVQDTKTAGAFTPRHGTVMPITAVETAALLKAFPTSDFDGETIKEPAELGKTADGETIVEPCARTAVIPYVKIHNGEWSESTDLTVNIGDSLVIGPHPWDGKVWSWSGPKDFKANTREVKFTNMDWTYSGYYNVVYTNETGCKTTTKFKVVVDDPSHPFVEPKDTVKVDTAQTDTSTIAIKNITRNSFVTNLSIKRVMYYNTNGKLLPGKPQQAGVYIRKELMDNGLVKMTVIRSGKYMKN